MSRSLGSAVDYSIIARGLQRAEDVYYAENRIFNAAFFGYAIKGAAKQTMDVRVIKGLAPDLLSGILKSIDEVILPIARNVDAGSIKRTIKETDKIAKAAGDKVSKLANDAWSGGKIPANVMDEWDTAAKTMGTRKTGKQLFAEAASNRAKKLAREETVAALTKEGLTEAAEALSKSTIAPSLKEIAFATTKREVMKAAVKSQEAFGWLLEQGTNPRTFKYLWGAGGLTVVGIVVWTGYKITNAVDNVVNKGGKTLFGESWEGGDGIASYGADNPVGAGIMGWGLVLGGLGLMYVLFKPKRAVVVS